MHYKQFKAEKRVQFKTVQAKLKVKQYIQFYTNFSVNF